MTKLSAIIAGLAIAVASTAAYAAATHSATATNQQPAQVAQQPAQPAQQQKAANLAEAGKPTVVATAADATTGDQNSTEDCGKDGKTKEGKPCTPKQENKK